jgi:hypothetical protein
MIHRVVALIGTARRLHCNLNTRTRTVRDSDRARARAY